MGFKRVKFNNFRNIKPNEIAWSGGLNLLAGPNGSGKTNILEGINILSGWGPLESGTKIKALPTWKSGVETVQLTGQLDGDYGEIIQVRISGRYSIRINDKAVTATDVRVKQPVLTFLPNDMQLIEGAAAYRRRLLDMILALIVPSYAMRLHEYKRGIRQKAFILKRGENTGNIDRVLRPFAAWIWKMRKETVALLSSSLSGIGELVPNGLELSLKRGGADTCDDENEDYIVSLERAEEEEKRFGMPLVGPHRDNIVLSIGDKLASQCLSRGYRRRASIALMLAAADGVARKLGNMPVLLLDEVTAELDAEGRDILFSALTERKTQVFAATAEHFKENYSSALYRVTDGVVERL